MGALQDGLWKAMAVLYDIIPSERLGMCPNFPIIIGWIQGTYYVRSAQSLCVQKASRQAPGLEMQLKKRFETS